MFETADFILHSGKKSNWKIDCDILTSGDWATLARLAVDLLPPYDYVYGIKTGGIPFAEAMQRYIRNPSLHKRLLIVDDVLTTGGSFMKTRELHASEWPSIIGCAAFARGDCPDWVIPLFILHKRLRNETHA